MNIGPAEILVIIVFALIIVGPDRLPKVGKTIGRALGQFRDAQDKVNEVVNSEKVRELEKNPFLALSKIGDALDPDGDAEGAGTGDGKAPEADAKPAGTTAADTAPAPATDGNPAPREGEHKVIRLSDRESFTQRKLRLKAQSESGASDAPASAGPDGGKSDGDGPNPSDGGRGDGGAL